MILDRVAFDGPVWRILAADRADDATGEARHPEGRFHHSGQPALYASLSAEGAGVAVARYLAAGDGPRVIARLRVVADLADLRGLGAAPSIVWQDIRAAGRPSPTWNLSDAARAQGAQGLIYRSRTRPDLTHLVLFDIAAARADGAAHPWP